MCELQRDLARKTARQKLATQHASNAPRAGAPGGRQITAAAARRPAAVVSGVSPRLLGDRARALLLLKGQRPGVGGKAAGAGGAGAAGGKHADAERDKVTSSPGKGLTAPSEKELLHLLLGAHEKAAASSYSSSSSFSSCMPSQGKADEGKGGEGSSGREGAEGEEVGEAGGEGRVRERMELMKGRSKELKVGCRSGWWGGTGRRWAVRRITPSGE